MIIRSLFWMVLLSSFQIQFSFSQNHETQFKTLRLSDVLHLAEQYSPGIQAAKQRERRAAETIRIEKSTYYPTFDFVALDSAGLPAAANALPGYNGLMMSPYREGLAAGVFSTLTFFDLTREFGLQTAKSGLLAAKSQTDVTRLQVDLKTMNLFMDAILNRAERDVWKQIQSEIDRLYTSVKKFVKSGQYSQVTQWLLLYQSEQAIQKQRVFNERFRSAIRRIEVVTGTTEGSLSLAEMETLDSALSLIRNHPTPESPLVINSKLEAQTSQAFASKQAAQNWPRLLGVASVGALEKARLVPLQNYAVWLGITFPIFEGFRISAQEQVARADADRKESLVHEAQLQLEEANIKYEEEVRARKIDLEQLQKEKENAVKALKLAEHRYLTFVGDLADVRDSLYSYEAAESGLISAKVELYRAQFSQAIINGITIQENDSFQRN
jgi:outer membrane protein TolC